MVWQLFSHSKSTIAEASPEPVMWLLVSEQMNLLWQTMASFSPAGSGFAVMY